MTDVSASSHYKPAEVAACSLTSHHNADDTPHLPFCRLPTHTTQWRTASDQLLYGQTSSSRAAQSYRADINNVTLLHPGLDWLLLCCRRSSDSGEGEKGRELLECEGQTEGGRKSFVCGSSFTELWEKTGGSCSIKHQELL